VLSAVRQRAAVAMTGRDSSAPEQPPPRADEGWRVFSNMIAGMILYGGVGWLIGHWTHIPILFPLGMLLGLALALLMIILRFTRS
jgi:F0F1-type ATP synthase assembly protein I